MTTEQLWQSVLGELELITSRANFTTWFKSTFIVSSDGGHVIVGVPNTFTKTWLEKKYHAAIVKALGSVLDQSVTDVVYRVEVRRGEPIATSTNIPLNMPTPAQQPVVATLPCGLNPKYRFETFVVGKGSELAHAATHAVATRPGQAYNPLFIYGGVGLGKTHLLQAAGLHLMERGSRVLYVTSDKFTNEYIQSVRAGHAKDFKDRYRSVDVLLIDDIQFIAGKEGTQEEFFHTFNALHQNNKQIILTSDRPPKAIPTLEQRLLSRFEWGMIADISQPDFETRLAILENKCKERRLNLVQEVQHFLATTFQHNIREMEGALNRIEAEQQFHAFEPDLAGVRRLFVAAETSTAPRRAVSPKRLIEAVCRYYDIPERDLVGKSRKRELVVPRQIVMYLMREEARASFPSIGNELGKRDHTTAMHGFEKIRGAIETDEAIRQDVLALRQQLVAA